MIRIENQELRVFAAVVEQNGFNKAAEQLCVTQSAVSQALANLERKLDARLLHRSPLRLTEAGARFLVYARNNAIEEERVLTDISEIQQGEAASLSLAVNSMINRYHAGTLINRYCGLHPFAQLSIEEMPSREIISAVMSGRVELGIGPFQTNMRAFEMINLFQETRSLVISRHYPDVEKVMAMPEQNLSQVPLIASFIDDAEDRPGGRRIRDHFSRHWQVRSISLRLELLAAGRGAGFVSDQVLVEDKLCEDLLVIDKLPFARIRRTVGILYRRGSELSEGAKKFIDICTKRWPS